MLKNYLKVAFRNVWKNKIFSAITISGLAIGMAACLLILQYVSFELSYDQFNKNANNIYRVVNDRYQAGKLIQHGTITYSAIGKAMQDDYPEIAEHARVEPLGNTIITYNDKKLEENGIAVDNSFLNMFSYPLLAGDAVTSLKEPNSVILSETLTRKLFDYKGADWQPFIGKTVVLMRDSMPYKITAICKDVPENSHLQFSFLVSYASLYSGPNGGWKQADYDFTDSDFWHYIQLKPGTDYKTLQAKFLAFSQRHFQGNKVSGSDETFYLQPLSKAHLYSDFEYEIGVTGSATVVWGLLAIALFIIVIAWVNYINLATAKSVERAKEVGIRKVVGGIRKQLIQQFLAESILLNLIALLLAFLIVLAAQLAFNRLVDHNLSISFLLEKGLQGYSILGGLVLLILTGILVSGFYPAFVLSSFRPIAVLKGKLSTSRKGVALRKVLVVTQFAITITLIIGSLVVYRQISFMNKQQLGLNIDQTLIIKPPALTNWDSTFIDKEISFKNEIKQLAVVKGAASSNRIPGDELGRNFNVRRMGADDNSKFTVRNLGVSHEFIQLYNMKLIAGRDFLPTDYNPDWNKLHNIVLTEMAVKLLGFTSPQDAVSKTIISGRKQWDVVGVVADFHQKSLRYPVEPTLLLPLYSNSGSISVKIAPADAPGIIAAIKQKYQAFFPGNLFDYYFLDEKFNAQYKNDQLFGKVFGLFSGLAIFIACLGLFGLSLFATVQRTKEVGVRKVLGASVPRIVMLLSKDFIRLVLIANLVAFPVAWWIMHNWLKNFAYRIQINWWLFAIAGLAAMLIAIGTVSFHAIKAAVANPVKSLRTE